MTIAAPTFGSGRARRFGLRFSAIGIAAYMMTQAAAAETAPALMPLPRSLEMTGGLLAVTGSFSTSISGCSDPMAATAAARFARDFAVLAGTSLSGPPEQLAIHCQAHDANLLSLQAKEAYRLSISATGVILDADGETGVVRGLATLRQLLMRHAGVPALPLVRIDDAPRFVWRGLMIDTARHFMSIEALKRQIDAMELAKLDVLHLHLSDNEAFRVESKRLPRLTEISGHGQFYTQDQIRDLVRYAGVRGVRIVPEFDMPGHCLAIIRAYPELAVTAIAPDDPLIMSKGALDPASEKTYRFVAALLREMTALFPDRQFHVGGDEVSPVAWQDSAEVTAFKQAHGLVTKQQLEAYFHRRVRKMLAAAGKTMVGWDEMDEVPQPRDLIIQTWRSSNGVSTATAQGHRVIVSAGYYLDQLRPADTLYAIDPLDPMAYTTMTAQMLAAVRMNPVTSAMVSDGLVAKPMPPLTPEQERLVLGVEAPLWSEGVSDEMLDGRLWPRALALGERFWSPAKLRDPDDMYARLSPAMEQLRSLGLLDEAHRDRMIVRLAPDQPEIVDELAGVVAPTRMWAHSHRMGMTGKVQELVEIADAASTDGLPARRFRVEAARYLQGDRGQASLLRAQLTAWRDNEKPFEQIAADRPLLAAAIPTAQDIAALGVLGLAALDALDQGKPIPANQAAAGSALLKKLKDFADASKDLGSVGMMKQPPADLIVLVAPDVGRLFEAAEAAKVAPRG